MNRPDSVAITAVKNGVPELIVTNLLGQEVKMEEGNWAYGLTDSDFPGNLYAIRQKSNALHSLRPMPAESSEKSTSATAQNFMLHLPERFYHAKIDQGKLYYVTTDNDIEFLHSVPLTGDEKPTKFPLKDFSNYDVTRGKVIVSDMAVREGDIHRTVF